MLDEATALTNFSDPVWRLSNLYWITDKRAQRVLFNPNSTQLAFINSHSKRDLILKARQLGMTTLLCLIGLDEALFNPNWRVAIIAHKLLDAQAFFRDKVKYPYDQLPDEFKRARPLISDRADSLEFNNGSIIQVTSSARSGTVNRLHISEFGKICALYPQKAREIITGSLPAAAQGVVTIESTAEGQEGKFYEYVNQSRQNPDRKGPKDWRFHFYPWWNDPDNSMSHHFETVTKEDALYFDTLKHRDKIDLTPNQKAWYIAEARTLGGDMKRENPSTPDEAFEAAIEGAYFAQQFAHADKTGQIGRFPYDPRYPVNTFWDLGMNDFTAIWSHQHINGRNRFIDYYENSGETLSHYAGYLRGLQRDLGYERGTDYWPHDGRREDEFLENGRLGEAEKQGFKPEIVSRVSVKMDAITAARAVFPSCDFHEEGVAKGLKRLRHYRKEYDEMRETWRDRPLHDDNSHGADAFMTFACGFVPPQSAAIVRHRKKHRGSAWAA